MKRFTVICGGDLNLVYYNFVNFVFEFDSSDLNWSDSVSYILLAEQFEVVSLWGAPNSPLCLQHLQLVGMPPLAAVQRRCRVHGELLHPDNQDPH